MEKHGKRKWYELKVVTGGNLSRPICVDSSLHSSIFGDKGALSSKYR